MKPYRPRHTWFVHSQETGPWTLKVYAMTAAQFALGQQPELSTGILEAALQYASKQIEKENFMKQPGNTAPHGFLTVHEGQEAVWLLIDLWRDDILHHHLFHASLASPTSFHPKPFSGSAACVWELEVIQHERNAWVRHVLSKPEAPDYDKYQRTVLRIHPRTSESVAPVSGVG